MSVTILRANALALPLADESVDLVVTSPPYSDADAVEFLRPGEARLKSLGHLGRTAGTAPAFSPDGQVGLGDEHLPGASADMRDVPKSHGLMHCAVVLPESACGLCHRDHRLAGNDVGKLPATARPLRVDCAHLESEPGREGKGALGGQKSLRPVGPNSGSYNALGALPGSVWTIPTEPLRVPESLGIDHFAAFPTELPRRIITGWSPRGVCVECGAGRRPVADVEQVARRPIGLQQMHTAMDARADKGIKSNIGHVVSSRTITGEACDCPEPTAPTDPKQRAKAARVEAVDPVPDDQPDLFEESA